MRAVDKWQEISARKDFQAFSEDKKIKIRNRFFERFIQPKVDADIVEVARSHFYKSSGVSESTANVSRIGRPTRGTGFENGARPGSVGLGEAAQNIGQGVSNLLRPITDVVEPQLGMWHNGEKTWLGAITHGTEDAVSRLKRSAKGMGAWAVGKNYNWSLSRDTWQYIKASRENPNGPEAQELKQAGIDISQIDDLDWTESPRSGVSVKRMKTSKIWKEVEDYRRSQDQTEDWRKGAIDSMKFSARRDQDDIEQRALGVDKWSGKGITQNAVGAIGGMIPAVAAGMVNPGLGASLMGGQVFGETYVDGLERGLDKSSAEGRAVVFAISEGLTERVPLGILMREGGSLLMRVLKSSGAEAIQESLVQAIHMGYDTQVLNDNMTWPEAIDQMAYAGLLGAIAGGVISVPSHKYVQSRERRIAQAHEQQEAQTARDQTLDELFSTVDGHGEGGAGLAWEYAETGRSDVPNVDPEIDQPDMSLANDIAEQGSSNYDIAVFDEYDNDGAELAWESAESGPQFINTPQQFSPIETDEPGMALANELADNGTRPIDQLPNPHVTLPEELSENGTAPGNTSMPPERYRRDPQLYDRRFAGQYPHGQVPPIAQAMVDGEIGEGAPNLQNVGDYLLPEKSPEEISMARYATYIDHDVITHHTRKGNKIKGVLRTDINEAVAKAIDPKSFRKNDGWFLNLKRLKRREATAFEEARAILAKVPPTPKGASQLIEKLRTQVSILEAREGLDTRTQNLIKTLKEKLGMVKVSNSFEDNLPSAPDQQISPDPSIAAPPNVEHKPSAQSNTTEKIAPISEPQLTPPLEADVQEDIAPPSVDNIDTPTIQESITEKGDSRTEEEQTGSGEGGHTVNVEPEPKADDADLQITQVPDRQIVEHTSKKGKTIRGVILKGVKLKDAKQIDPYTFRKNGGWFIREKHLDKLEALESPPKNEEPKDAERTSRDKKKDSANGKDAVSETERNISDEQRGASRRETNDVRQEPERTSPPDDSLDNRGTASHRESSDHGAVQTEPGTTDASARDSEPARGSDNSSSRLPDGESRQSEAKKPADRKERLELGEKSSITKQADIDQIKDRMPFLTDGQAQDVGFAETRFEKDDGYGVLFTNGTGTGKTFTGLGIIRRFVDSGKGNVLIVAPKQTIADAWAKAAKTFFQIDVHRLADTKDSGKGVAITTYANMGSNPSLITRDYDLVVLDEAHYLSSDSSGRSTKSLDMLRAITLKSGQGVARDRVRGLHPDKYAELSELRSKVEALEKKTTKKSEKDREKLNKKISEILKDIDALAKEEGKRIAKIPNRNKPRSLFLSATPFSYEKSVSWANEFLFNWGTDKHGLGYNSGNNFDQFMMQHFGYRMRYNKLTEPEAGVDRGLMQRQFNAWLRKEGVLSSRALDSEFDYDRKFLMNESMLGKQVDDALDWLWKNSSQEGPRGAVLKAISGILNDSFGYQQRMYFLEAIKAQQVGDIVRDHLEHGRKVVVMHDFKKGGVINPFRIKRGEVKSKLKGMLEPDEIDPVIDEFNKEFSHIVNAFSAIPSPIDTLTSEFPDALIYNGDHSAKSRVEMQERFNSDADESPRIMIAQNDAMREGVSIHDTTGKFPRVEVQLGLPSRPVATIQLEGRIYRTGQKSNALFRYMTIGTNWERFAFASKISERASAAENLALGEEARSLKDAFIDGYSDAAEYPAGFEGEGTGGKEQDNSSSNVIRRWDQAKAFYFGTKKQGSGRSARGREQSEFFATPEPVGLKMVDMLDLQADEKALEPSAGHGAIGRWFPDNTTNKAIEYTARLSSQLSLRFNGDVTTGDFMQHKTINKYHGIAMNPPFGAGGAQARDHVKKAYDHLYAGGRLVALVPQGPAANKKFEKLLFDEKEGLVTTENAHLVADIELPNVTFERAGTKVSTRVLVIDKMPKQKKGDDDVYPSLPTRKISYANAESVHELFDRIENLEIPKRWREGDKHQPRIADKSEIQAADNVAEELAGKVVYQRGEIGLVTAFASGTGDILYVPFVGDSYASVDISNFTGRQLSQDQKSQLAQEKERLEGIDQTKHNRNPFITFDEQIEASENVSKEVHSIVKEWAALLGITDNIYLTTTQDAIKNKDNFTGPHRPIGRAALNHNENGATRRLDDGSHFLTFSASTSKTKVLETIAHELGHIHQKTQFLNAPKEVQDSIKAEHQAWVKKQKGISARQLVDNLRAKTSAKTTFVSDGALADRADAYWTSMSEWYADQVSRWAMTSQKPQSVVQKFFKRLGAALKTFYLKAKNAKYLPSATFKNYLDNAASYAKHEAKVVVDDTVSQSRSELTQEQTTSGLAQRLDETIESAGKRTVWDAVKSLASNKMTEAAKSNSLGALTLRQLGEVFENIQPKIKEYVAVADRMIRMRNHMAFESGNLADRWQKWALKNRSIADKLHDLMHRATLFEVDPSQARYINRTSELRILRARLNAEFSNLPQNDPMRRTISQDIANINQKLSDEQDRQIKYRQLRSVWESLPTEAREFYIEVREQHKAMHGQNKALLFSKLERARESGINTRVVRAVFDVQFKIKELSGPYFPLSRFGKYWIEFESEGERQFMTFETKPEQKKMLKAISRLGISVKSGVLTDPSSFGKTTAGFVDDIMGALDGMGSSDTRDVKDIVFQMHLKNLPERTMLKNRIHRKGIKGYSRNAIRATADAMSKQAYQLARLSYSDQMGDLMKKMEKDAKDGGNEKGFAYNEMVKRHEWVMNPSNSSTANTITSAGFLYLLAGSPAAAGINLTQTFTTGVPSMAAELDVSMAKAATRLVANSRKFNVVKGRIADAQMTQNEKRAMDEWIERGVIDNTGSHALLGIAESGGYQYSDRTKKILESLGWMFHRAEQFNREVTALSTYQLAVESGKTHEQAVSLAAHITHEAHFDYANHNRARFMQGDFAKVTLQFKQYSQNMTYYLLRNAQQGLLSGDFSSPKAKKARKKLIGTLGITAILGGLGALPLSAFYAIANFFLDDEDDPFDAKVEFNAYLSDTLGKKAADYIMHGVGGAGLSGRVSLDGMWMRDPGRDIEAKDMYEHLLPQLAGPVVGGIAPNFFRGAGYLKDGEHQLAFEKVVPKFLRDVSKAARYYDEGQVNRQGAILKRNDEFTGIELAMQAVGFSDSDVIKQYIENNAIKNYSNKIKRRRKALLNKYYRAWLDRNNKEMNAARRAINRFNKANAEHPALHIDPKTLSRSLKTRERVRRSAVNGMTIRNSEQHLLESLDLS